MSKSIPFDPGLDIRPTFSPLGFSYGRGIFGPQPELRHLDTIRTSLYDPKCDGPDPVYAIAMNVGKDKDRVSIEEHRLLFGVVAYAPGKLGREAVRSQGHVHTRARGRIMSSAEVYEIWSGRAIIYMQERVEKDPGRCFAVEALPGDAVLVPPDWAHAAVNADPMEPLVLGAWCEREYGFDYARLRSRGGPAWFPLFDSNGEIEWIPNGQYARSRLIPKAPEKYPDLGVGGEYPIYELFERNRFIFDYVAEPEMRVDVWKRFVP